MGRNRRITRSVFEKEARAARRQALGPLRTLIVKPGTLARYVKAFKMFFVFLLQMRLSLPADMDGLDTVAAQLISDFWEDGEGVGLATDLLAALQHLIPRSRRNLQESWKYVKGWQQNEVPERATPFDIPLLLAFISAAVQLGFLDVGVILGLEFLAFLRTGEGIALRKWMVRITNNIVVLTVVDTKTSRKKRGTIFRYLVLLGWFGCSASSCPPVDKVTASCRHPHGKPDRFLKPSPHYLGWK